MSTILLIMRFRRLAICMSSLRPSSLIWMMGQICTFSRFADDSKMGGMTEHHAAVQENLLGWRNWPSGTL